MIPVRAEAVKNLNIAMVNNSAIVQTEFTGLPLFRRGKVRDVYDLGDTLLIVATDRISAFDAVMPDPIPDKGTILTAISAFWFEKTRTILSNHLLSVDPDDYPSQCRPYRDILQGRSMLVRKTQAIPVECIVRGYLSGSGWKEYQKHQSICGISLPDGLTESARLSEPIFTPTTKAEAGHDQNITFEETIRLIGEEVTNTIRRMSIAIYTFARDYALSKGIIIADTKMEFGIYQNEIILIDELLTPDSSRFWPADQYTPGKSQPSYDKQYLRDYLLSIGWDSNTPPPRLPETVIANTREKYRQAYLQLTGNCL